ncbi:MAG TPA: ATPase [Lentisphaeria bacterium]|nr:MAG: ATPase [Lentisphaerae bacterium GWF2_38_69]HBM15762.1 ATPase [Lentisphaeria bacterium]
MKIAIPTANGKLCMHFGHCEIFTIYDVCDKDKVIKSVQTNVPPAHEPGVLPKWLGELGANVIIAGGMGSRAQQLFAENGVKVVTGAPAENPESVIKAYLDGSLVPGANVCDH